MIDLFSWLYKLESNDINKCCQEICMRGIGKLYKMAIMKFNFGMASANSL